MDDIDNIVNSLHILNKQLRHEIEESNKYYLMASGFDIADHVEPEIPPRDIVGNLNYDSMDDDELMKLYNKIFNRKLIIRELLLNELTYYIPDIKLSTIELFKKFVKSSLIKFQQLCGTFEDVEWIENFIETKEGCQTLCNTVKRTDQWDKSLKIFLYKFTDYCNRVSDICLLKYKIIDSDERCYIVLKLKPKKKREKIDF